MSRVVVSGSVVVESALFIILSSGIEAIVAVEGTCVSSWYLREYRIHIDTHGDIGSCSGGVFDEGSSIRSIGVFLYDSS